MSDNPRPRPEGWAASEVLMWWQNKKRIVQIPAIRQGGVYVLKDCPPLRGVQKKDRPVVVVSKPQTTVAGGDHPHCRLLDQCRRGDGSGHHQATHDARHTPGCRTGLWSPCHAIPEWYLEVTRNYPTDYRGYVTDHRQRRQIDRH